MAIVEGGVQEGRSPFINHSPLLESSEGVSADMSLRRAQRRSKLKDKDKIASPLARNDTQDTRVWGLEGVRYDKLERSK